MNVIKFFASTFSALLMCLPSFAAKTLYVNNAVGNDDYDGLAAVYDGTHGPKSRIQAAIGAAESGDTVVVAPGVYGNEQGYVPASEAGQTVRVYIDKAITLKSSGGRAATFIVGKRGSADDGTGEGAVTGMRVAATVATGADDPVEIQGFTFRDCYSDAADSDVYGGVVGWRASSGPVLADGTGPWVVDCTVSNCTYHASGALGRVNAARTLVSGNSSSAIGVNAVQCNLVHCALTGFSGQVGMNGTSKQYAINCTVSDGSNNPCSSGCRMYFLNTAFTALANCTCNCTAASNSVIVTSGKNGDFSDSGNLKGYTYAHSQIAAPLLGDFRPLAAVEGLCSNASLCGAGDPKWLGLVPEKYRYTDMEGNAFGPDADGRIAIGAVQTPVTPVAGFRVGDTASGNTYAHIRVNGKRGSATSVSYAGYIYLDGSSWPRCYEITADVPEGKRLWAFKSTDKEEFRFPTKDGRILFVPALGKTITITPVLADKVYYVDDMNGDDDAYDGLSSVADGTAGPFQTIQKAIDTAANGNFVSIYVAPGLYNKGASPYSDDAAAPLCRVKARWASSYFRIVATGSAEETVIAGAPDTTSEYRDANGNGPDAVRCIRFHPAAKCCVQGFTVTGGHTDSDAHSGTTTWKGGGAFMTDGGKLSWLMDCIVSNNHSAVSGAAMYYGSAARCRFIDNRVSASEYSAFIGNVRLLGCTVEVTDDSLALRSAMGDNVTAVNCSSRCPAASRLFPVSGHGFLFNNIVFNNQAMDGDETVCASGNVLDRTEYADSVLNAEGTAYVAADAGYLDPDGGDLRISSGSAAIGAGTAWTELSGGSRIPQAVAWTNYYSILQHDFDGNGPFFTDGNPTAGAYQKPAKHLVTVSLNRPGDISVSSSETNLLDFGESLALSATDGKRKVMGFEVNGEFIEGTSFSVNAPGQAAGGLTAVKVFANTNWYVDAVNGSDDGTGWTEDDAFLTLSNAVSVAIPGDVVVALPGTYSEGTMIQAEMAVGSAYSPVLRSRVIVPGGVSLVSRDGAEATVIKGECADPDVDNGLGEGSVRCVYMLEGARLSGFTITGGSTLCEGTDATDNNSGAGIFCAEAPMGTKGNPLPETLVTDCIVSNNACQYGGGGAYRGCRVVRCRFFDNGCWKEGGALAECCIYGCVFDRNYGMYGVNQPREVRGCTFGPETFRWSKTGSRCALRSDPNSAVWPVYNCLFLGGTRCPVKHVYNCIEPESDFIYSSKTSPVHSDILTAEVETDGNYAPARDSAAANAVNTEYVSDLELDGDVYGNPRRSNGGMDVGAVETDWRPRYAAFLGSRVTVPEVSWEATATGSPGILLPDGSSLSAEWTYGVAGRGTAVVKFTVDEGAVLTIRREGKEPLTFGAGAGEYRFRDAREYESFAFSVAGGDAELLGIDRDMPLSIVIR